MFILYKREIIIFVRPEKVRNFALQHLSKLHFVGFSRHTQEIYLATPLYTYIRDGKSSTSLCLVMTAQISARNIVAENDKTAMNSTIHFFHSTQQHTEVRVARNPSSFLPIPGVYFVLLC